MKFFNTFFLLFSVVLVNAQSASIKGQLQDADGAAVIYATVALHASADSSLVKVETSDESGVFNIIGIAAGNYFLKATYVGSADLEKTGIELTEGQQLDLGVLSFNPTVELTQATVTAQRAMVEVKPDRTVFNVEGTINSVGSDAIELLRKAPGVTVDNNDNINVLGRAGVMVYVDGKRLPLGGDDLSNYLKNLSAEQIDRMDIITNPGAKYEAEGNAGIIDIRLKKDKNLGANGSLNGTLSKGELWQNNGSFTMNYRNKFANVFGQLGVGDRERFDDMVFVSEQNGLILDEINNHRSGNKNYNYRIGTDFFLSKNQTLGFLISGGETDGDNRSFNRIEISRAETPDNIDSILVADNQTNFDRQFNTYNINYQYEIKKGRTLNVDLDYGRYQNASDRFQPNQYFDATETNVLTEVINSFDTGTDIDIYTFKADYEEDIWGGKLGIGTKLSKVVTDNQFFVFDGANGSAVRNDTLSNRFEYDENVYAGYISFARPINDKWNFSAGLRAERTKYTGDLQAFVPELQEPPVDSNYISWFPTAGLTWQIKPMHSLSLNYGRRINRPDYNVLNPFNNRISELSYEKGNPRLSPEIVNNIELGYTLKYRYNFKIAYSRTTDQITRLIAPDEEDQRAGFITWANLAEQTIWSANASLPMDVMKGWNAYVNLSANYQDNQADYGDGATVDLQAWSYNIYMQNTIDLPAGFKGEVSGWFSGPGIWGGVFKYETSYSLNLGLQRKFFNESLNVRLSVNDIAYQTGWDGYSEFDGLFSTGSGRWDSRRASLSLSYRFGNQNVKSRKRKTGMEDEAGRVSN
ncbi:MAG: TonB-dependent receptor [Bacteroidota bacterium]